MKTGVVHIHVVITFIIIYSSTMPLTIKRPLSLVFVDKNFVCILPSCLVFSVFVLESTNRDAPQHIVFPVLVSSYILLVQPLASKYYESCTNIMF